MARGERATEDEMVNGITDSTDMSLSKLWKIVKDREAWRAAVHGVAELGMTDDWTRTKMNDKNKEIAQIIYIRVHPIQARVNKD